jgi:hypothetical protein
MSAKTPAKVIDHGQLAIKDYRLRVHLFHQVLKAGESMFLPGKESALPWAIEPRSS